MTKTLTIDKILSAKKLAKKSANKNFYSKTFDAEIEIQFDNPEGIIEIFSENESEYRKYLKLIYECCPIFKAPELRQEFPEVKEPYDIITKVFGDNINEIMELGNFLLIKFGFLNEDDLKKLKKQ